jgi:hypothetical protein
MFDGQRGFKEDKLVAEASVRDGDLYTFSCSDHFSICQPKDKTSASFSKLIFLVDTIEVRSSNSQRAKA